MLGLRWPPLRPTVMSVARLGRLIYAASRGTARSTNRKYRVLRAPATTPRCDLLRWPSIRAFVEIWRRKHPIRQIVQQSIA